MQQRGCGWMGGSIVHSTICRYQSKTTYYVSLQIVDRHYEKLKSSRPDSQTLLRRPSNR
jgi:hypothetical protein